MASMPPYYLIAFFAGSYSTCGDHEVDDRTADDDRQQAQDERVYRRRSLVQVVRRLNDD